MKTHPAIQHSVTIYVCNDMGHQAAVKLSSTANIPIDADKINVPELMSRYAPNISGWRLMTEEEVERYLEEENE
jgi:hypothetical protein